jgi:ABC-type uncharacterized transport system involved in gliding motility auxiliary subunit
MEGITLAGKAKSYVGILAVILLALSLLLRAGEMIGGITFGILFILGMILILAFLGANFTRLKGLFAGRSAKYGAGALSASLFVLGILVIVNYLSLRHNFRYDSTSAKSFSLADQTTKVLENLDRDVKIIPFFKEETPGRGVLEDLLEEYEYASSRISVEFLDPDKDPTAANRYRIREYGTTIVEAGEKVERVESVLEQDITNAIIKVSKDDAVRIYFLEGHGERDYEDQARGGYDMAGTSLRDENYELDKLFLLREGEVPKDCDVLIVAGPENEPEPHEIAAMNDYLHKGGKILALVDPRPAASLEDLFSKWSIEVGDDVVVDVSPAGRLFGANEFMPMSMSYGSHPITEGFNVATLFAQCRSVEAMEDSVFPELRPVVLLESTEQSWAEKGELSGTIKFDADVDVRGPVPLGVALSEPSSQPAGEAQEADTLAKETRIVVLGDSDFASNSYFGFSGNKDFFLNIVNWLGEQEELISIRPKAPEDRRVSLTRAQSRFLFYLLVVVLPLGALVSGGIVWWRRR